MEVTGTPFEKPITDNELKWIGVDLDKTLANNSGYPNFDLLEPMEGAIDAIWEIVKRGFKITIVTSRAYPDYHKIEAWCEKYNVPVRRIICGKPLVRWMVDDRNIEFKGDWKETLTKIV